MPHYEQSLQLLLGAAATDLPITVAKAVFNDTTYERLTLHTLATSQIDPDAAYLYMHTKGCTKIGSEFECVQDWRRCIEYFLVERIASCLEVLQTKQFDMVGIMYLLKPRPHFSGNLWWASGAYLRKLIAEQPVIGPAYFDTEMWAAGAGARCHSFFPITRAHYHQRMFRHEYAMD